MKQLSHTLCFLVAAFLLAVSCVDPLEPILPVAPNGLPANALIFTPGVRGAKLVTKAAQDGDPTGKDPLGELALETLDIYVYKEGDNALFKGYHFLKAAPSDGTTVPDNVIIQPDLSSGSDLILETNWETQGYSRFQDGSTTLAQKYDIYVIANSRMETATRWGSLTRKALCAAVSTSPKSIQSSNNKLDLFDVIRLKGDHPADNYYDAHIPVKNFLMDGMVSGWTIDPSAGQQYFNTSVNAASQKIFSLQRAAAKFEVSLTFDKSFLELLNNEQTTLTAAPQLKFSNFMPVTYEITPATGTAVDNSHLFSSDERYDFSGKELRHDNDITVEDHGHGAYTYKLTTYGYSYSLSEGAASAPALIVSVGYKTGTTTEYNYYRIPLVDIEKISSIDRNHYYLVDAVITSKGGATEEIEPVDVKLNYQVIPWSFNEATDITEVEGAELYYFTADTVFTLRGENTQTKELDYFTPQSELQNNHYVFEPKLSNFRVYYVPAPGDTTFINRPTSNPGTYTYNTSTTTNRWTGAKTNSGETVTINVLPANDGGGQVKISSEVLANRAVKHIEFDATVTFKIPILDNDGVPTGEYNTVNVVRHYHILHFPLDNIQSVTGWWSSRWSGRNEGGTRTGESSSTLPDSWGNNYEMVVANQDNTVNLDPDQRSAIFGAESNSDVYATGHRTRDNGVYYNGYVYWVTRTGGGFWGYTYTYHRASVTFYRTQGGYPGTGDWVSWNPNNPGTNYDYNGGNGGNYGQYYAKVYGSEYCYYITGNATRGNAVQNLVNQHMYVIQISRAGVNNDGQPVIIGRPHLDNNSQSNDNVVSPAFMIASQLGATTTFGTGPNAAQYAADHCSSYLEVAENGRRYAGWRLPTPAEIKFIVEYQNNPNIAGAGVFQDVFIFGHYYTLDNTATSTGISDNNYGVRCIRDLTPEEVAELNSTGTITAATY